ncbi:MAG TPA: glycosyltransferase [Longimicrobiales bacterium]|nr:glycosyltransferase [Longimicrobiales bacterium]
MAHLAWLLVQTLNWLVLTYFVLLNLFYLGTSLFAFRALRRYSRRLKALDVEDLVASGGAPSITLIAPAYNEASTIVESVRSLLTLKYPEYDILVVNDGSRDATLARLQEAFELEPTVRAPTADIATMPVRALYRSRRYPNLWVIDKENGGKADTLNAGLVHARTPLFCAMDADSLLEPEALIRVVRPFLEDESTVAVGGIIRIVNGCRVRSGEVVDVRLPESLLARFQVLEYLRAFLSGRMGWDALRATLIISGAFGIFRRDVVVDAGGFAPGTVGEDLELVVRLHRHCLERGRPYRIAFVPDPVAWTEAPEDLRVLAGQRDRWQRGLAETLTRHRTMLLRARYGRIGLFAYPYFYFLELMGPVIELLGYTSFLISVLLGWASASFVAAFLLVAFVFGTALSTAAVGLEELTFRRYPRTSDLLKLFWLAVAENFGYRQLVAFWRTRGIWSWLRRVEGWGEMTRTGFRERGGG